VSDTEALMEVQNWTDEQKLEADVIQQRLEVTLSEIQERQDGLEKNFAQLGNDLLKIQHSKFWILYGDYKSYNQWLKSIEPRVRKGRSQLYAVKTIAEKLLPFADEDEIVEMGVSKASALATAIKNSGGKAPPDKLLKDAKNPDVTVEELGQLIADNYGLRDELEVGVWLALGGVFFSSEEKAEFQRAIAVACKIDPPLSYVIEEWGDATAAQKKEVLWRMTSSFLAEYESQVEKGIA
jgi:hypothetical protein